MWYGRDGVTCAMRCGTIGHGGGQGEDSVAGVDKRTGGGGPGFVHLRVRSAYSLLEGALPIKKLIGLAVSDAQPALAICDTGNLFGALEFCVKLAEAGVQPIVGMTLALDMADDVEDAGIRLRQGPRDFPAIALYAQNEEGYRNLMALSSEAFLDTDAAERPHVGIETLAGRTAGLIALTGGSDGPVNQALLGERPEQALGRLRRLSDLFNDRLYVELQRHGMDGELLCEPALLDMAYDLSVPLAASNDVLFPKADDFEAHDALLCVAEGRLLSENKRRRMTPEHYFKSRSEMGKLFEDLPEALANTVEIAQRCSYWPQPAKPMLPKFSAGDADEDSELAAQAQEGLARRLAAHGVAPGADEQTYRERLAFELDVITRMRYSGYFLIVSDFIKWAKAQSIPVGPGRGSGAGSVVAWALTITDLDPIRFGLLFERFLNPERVSMPDFDIDFCQDRRDEVIRYVQERYGVDRVAQIITFGTLQARAVLRDVGRVLEMRYGEVDALCKLVPNNPAKPTTLAEAIAGEPRLQEARDGNPLVAQLLRISLRLEGLYRHASTHAAGIVIGERALKDIVPLYRDPRSSMPVTQFNMKWVEQAGLVKFDFLGLKTLTVLENTVKLLAKRGVALDMSTIPLNDAKTYELLSSGDTVGVFQVESAGMRDALKRMKPDRLEDIIALVALYRPGPMDNIPTYCNRKQGKEKPDYLHPKLQPILEETYGVIIYQEQVMQIAQVLSGYSLGQADLLRRAMGKKIKAEMDQQRAGFVDGAVANGIGKAQAQQIFELVAKFADYGFNKSHAAAYALIAYQTAYLKANYPVEFLAASMTLDTNNTDKLNDFRREAERLGIVVAPPSINQSGVEFLPHENTIHYAIAAIKTVGRQAVEQIVAERDANGAFRDLTDFATRINPKALNRRALENMAAAGVFDALEPNRARVVAGAEAILAMASSTASSREQGQDDLFGGGGGGAGMEALRLPAADLWLPMERLSREFNSIGFFLSGHPLDDYAAVLKRLKVMSFAEFSQAVARGITAGRLAGSVVQRQERRSKSGNKFAFVGFSDPTGQYEAVIFADTLAETRDLLEPGSVVIIGVEADVRETEVRLRVQSVEPVEKAADRVPQAGLRIMIEQDVPLDGLAARLAAPGKGEINVVVLAEGGQREVEVRLPGGFKVSPQIAGALKALPGVMEVELL